MVNLAASEREAKEELKQASKHFLHKMLTPSCKTWSIRRSGVMVSAQDAGAGSCPDGVTCNLGQRTCLHPCEWNT